jgi:hypothetical protein
MSCFLVVGGIRLELWLYWRAFRLEVYAESGGGVDLYRFFSGDREYRFTALLSLNYGVPAKSSTGRPGRILI